MSDHHFCTEVTPQCPVSATLYGYAPNLVASYCFVAIFSVCCLAQIILGIRYKTYPFLVAAFLGMMGEAVGYGGRVMMHHNPWSSAGFKIQICCLVLAPSFLAACIYLSLKHIVRYCGPQYSRLKPKLYTWWFIGGDFGSICVQAVGGGVASAGEHNASIANAGDRIILVGIALQLVVMTVAGIFIAEFAYRLRKQQPQRPAPSTTRPDGSSSGSDEEKNAPVEQPVVQHTQMAMAVASGGPGVEKKFQTFLWGLGIAALAIYIRCIYRIPEMSGGWGGPLMRKENDFYILDGMMCAIACIAFTVVHPAFYFPSMRRGFEW